MSREDLMLAAMEIREECKAHPDSCLGCSWCNEAKRNETGYSCAFAACNCPEDWTFRHYITEEVEA